MPVIPIPPQINISTHNATSKTPPVDADELPLVDSAASWSLKKLTWQNLKAALKTYFDTLYTAHSALFNLAWSTSGHTIDTPINMAGNAIQGNTTSGGNLTLSSTSHATKGKILFGDSAYNEETKRLNLGSTVDSTNGKLYVYDNTLNSSLYGVDSYLTHAISSTGTYYSRGLSFRAHKYVSSGITDSGYAVGFWGQAFAGVDGIHDGTLASLYGGVIATGIYETGHSGTVTNAYGLSLVAYAQSGVITNLYMLYLPAKSGSGTVTNYFGVYQADTTAINYLGGNTGCGVTVPTSKLHTTSFARAAIAKSTTYTATAADSHFDVIAASGWTLTLPAVAGCIGREYSFKKTDNNANVITIKGNASENIDAANTYVGLSAQYKYLRIIANSAGTAWDIIGSN